MLISTRAATLLIACCPTSSSLAQTASAAATRPATRKEFAAALGRVQEQTPATQPELYARLDALGQLQSQDYVRQRDQLLREHPTKWSVQQASAFSWRAGVAAFVLNDRLRERARYQRMDRQRPTLYRSLQMFGESTVPFLVEKIWKGDLRPVSFSASSPHLAPLEGDTDERMAAAARNDLRLLFVSSWSPAAVGFGLPIEMCLAIWKADAHQGLTEVALWGLAGSDDTAGLMVARDVLLQKDFPQDLKRIVLDAIRSTRSKAAASVVIDASPALISNSPDLAAAVVLALGAIPDERAREALHGLVLDSQVDDELRWRAISACNRYPRKSGEDIDVLRKVFKSYTKWKVSILNELSNYPYRLAVPFIREVLKCPTESDEVITGAINTLIRIYEAQFAPGWRVFMTMDRRAQFRADLQALASIHQQHQRSEELSKLVASSSERLSYIFEASEEWLASQALSSAPSVRTPYDKWQKSREW